MPLKTKKSKKLNYTRPPIVAVLGHVDHGKTTLLDAIRESNIVSFEHGGITQHIGAYQIEYKGKKITFIDTPGHAAFSKMRSHGVAVTDLVILVVAANDGVKPQTKESIVHINQAKCPFIVAINKIDLPQISCDLVKSQLAEVGVLVEKYGGDVVCVEISAREKKGISDLLEMILLLAEMQNLKAVPNGKLRGAIIDSYLDPKKGPVATVLVKNGTLRVKDKVYAGEVEGKIKLMFDEFGKEVIRAIPSMPVKVLGFKKVPAIGSEVKDTPEDFKVAEAVKEIPKKNKSETKKEGDLQPEDSKKNDNKIKLILKADTAGTLEAIKSSLPTELEIILAEVGDINESDVLLSISTKADIYGFNVKTKPSAKKLAETENITIKTYNIIYKLLEEIEKRILKIMEPTIDEEVIGEAEIIAEFNIKDSHVAGCKIIKGKIGKTNPIHIKRGKKIIADVKIKSFQKENKEIDEAGKGSEVGLVFKPDVDFKIRDAIISYKILE